MARKVEAWRADDSSLHTTEREAATHNVKLLVLKLSGDLNDPVRLSLVLDWMIGGREDILRVLADFHRCHPLSRAMDSREEAPEKGPKGPASKGPASGDYGRQLEG